MRESIELMYRDGHKFANGQTPRIALGFLGNLEPKLAKLSRLCAAW